MALDPNSIKRLRHGKLRPEQRAEILKALIVNKGNIRKTAMELKYSTKTVHDVRKEHNHLFPKPEKKEKGRPFDAEKVPVVQRALRVPVDVDERIVLAATVSKLKWQGMANRIFREWSDKWTEEKEEFFHMSLGSERFSIPFVDGETSIQMRERVVSHLNEHGKGSAMVEDNGISYHSFNSVVNIEMGVEDD